MAGPGLIHEKAKGDTNLILLYNFDVADAHLKPEHEMYLAANIVWLFQKPKPPFIRSERESDKVRILRGFPCSADSEEFEVADRQSRCAYLRDQRTDAASRFHGAGAPSAP